MRVLRLVAFLVVLAALSALAVGAPQDGVPCPLDISVAVVWDSSSTVSQQAWEAQKNFTTDLLTFYAGGYSGFGMSVIQSAVDGEPRVDVPFARNLDPSVVEAVSRLPSGGTAPPESPIADAISAAQQSFVADTFNESLKLVLLLTTGLPSNKTNVQDTAEVIRAQGTWILSVGVDVGAVDLAVLSAISTSLDLAFYVPTPEDIIAVVPDVAIATCINARSLNHQCFTIGGGEKITVSVTNFVEARSVSCLFTLPGRTSTVSAEGSYEPGQGAVRCLLPAHYQGGDASVEIAIDSFVFAGSPLTFTLADDTELCGQCDSANNCTGNGDCQPAGTYARTCNCFDGFSGIECQYETGGCAPNPCKNGGQCHPFGTNSFSCSCPSPYGGVTCDEITACNPNPCSHGTCSSLNNGESYECECFTGFAGVNCTQDLGACVNNPCQNDGVCVPVGSFGHVCYCATGWQGPTCGERDNCLDFDPCVNGECHHAHTPEGYFCDCYSGFEGVNCTEVSGPCSTNPCQNSGECVVDGDGHKCNCAFGYMGPTCAERDRCEPNPCVRGTCTHTLDQQGYSCNCTDGWTGTNCNVAPNPCATSPCLNGGTCLPAPSRPDGFICNCPRDRTGVTCESRVKGSSPSVAIALAVIAVLVVLMAGAYYWWRKRPHVFGRGDSSGRGAPFLDGGYTALDDEL